MKYVNKVIKLQKIQKKETTKKCDSALLGTCNQSSYFKLYYKYHYF